MAALGAAVLVAVLAAPRAEAVFGDSPAVTGNDLTAATLQPPSNLNLVISCDTTVAPSFVAASTATGSASPVTATRPTGAVAGDLLLAQVTADDASAVAASGWTLIRQDKDTGEGFWQAALYRFVTSSEPSSYTFNVTQSGTPNENLVGISAYRGVDPSTPIDAHGGQITTWPPGTNTITAPSVTTTVAQTRLVALFGRDGAEPITPPASLTTRWSAIVTANGTDGAALGADEVRTSPGATGTRVATAGGIQNNSIGQSIALRPDSSAAVKVGASWSATPSPFAQGYRLQRWRNGSLESDQAIAGIGTTTATDGPVTAGTSYEYRLYATYENWTSVTVVRNITPVCTTGASLLWSRSGATAPLTAELANWYPTTQPTASVGRWRVLEAAVSPTRNEAIAVGVRADGAITGQMRTGSTWTALAANPLATAQPVGWVADVAYESVSGDLMMVWANGTTGSTSVSYRVWNGSSWSAIGTFGPSAGEEARHVRLASNPGADEMILVVSDDDNDDYALVWNGSSWVPSATQVLDSGGVGSGNDPAVAYEQQSGDALVTYRLGNGAGAEALRYRVWNGSWGAEQSLATPVNGNGHPEWTVLAAAPGSDRLAVGVLTDSNAVWLATWTGSAWVNTTLANTNASTTAGPAVAVAFEPLSGNVLAAYSIAGGNSFGFRSWTPSGWGGQGTVTAIGAEPRAIRADGRPGTDQVIVSVQDSNRTLTYLQRTGAGIWTVLTNPLLETDTGEVDFTPFALLWN